MDIALHCLFVAYPRVTHIALVGEDERCGERRNCGGGLFIVVTYRRDYRGDLAYRKISGSEQLKREECAALCMVAAVDGVAYIVEQTRYLRKLAGALVIAENFKNPAGVLARFGGVGKPVLREAERPEHIVCGVYVTDYFFIFSQFFVTCQKNTHPLS